MVNILYPKSTGDICLLQGMRFILGHRLLKGINRGNEVCPQSLNPEHAISPHIQDLIPQKDSGSNSPQVRVATPLKEMSRDSLT